MNLTILSQVTKIILCNIFIPIGIVICFSSTPVTVPAAAVDVLNESAMSHNTTQTVGGQAGSDSRSLYRCESPTVGR